MPTTIDDDLRLLYTLHMLGSGNKTQKPKMQDLALAMGLKTTTCGARYNTLMKKLQEQFPEVVVAAAGSGSGSGAAGPPTTPNKRKQIDSAAAAAGGSVKKAKGTPQKKKARVEAKEADDGNMAETADFVKVEEHDHDDHDDDDDDDDDDKAEENDTATPATAGLDSTDEGAEVDFKRENGEDVDVNA